MYSVEHLTFCQLLYDVMKKSLGISNEPKGRKNFTPSQNQSEWLVVLYEEEQESGTRGGKK